MRVTGKIAEIRQWTAEARAAGKGIGLVPTMGALHVGHASLIDEARRRCGFVVVSLFVNPTQFGPGEDFDNYPRPFERDLALCEQHGVDVVFAPSAAEMYPRENLSWVTVSGITEHLCGRSRPNHFRGVTTVCTKLFNIVGCDVAFFGQKDAQQCVVIRRMVADLNMPLEILVCPTVREADGLAVSSRNQYLSAQQRKDAPIIYEALKKGREMIEAGETDPARVRERIEAVMRRAPALQIEYISLVDPETLEDVKRIGRAVLIAVAARLGPARLIDNIVVDSGR
ncbi:MAG: pantoate--beta-alanine ligase [Sedimentisphaerales bacterium]|jgi:pantoate--beta-alanine ligase|nr:pantoate--beta-alanine ligase [Sedimentisphaerales bacterium]HNY79771.1 pantoate--beta-alanine ligase [Sedimentisphaerales bacterium]HOC62251.1 pantoate--beta-alanine ligase [Sedimentisphaerales bacterium]HOH63108.1 pantoate--beta-alanine ligase [Sedimentisphaerales bacterium]HPY50329.1 pantoate--beta-alanine ligase [Sedimentisphaerales bacterium]